MITHEMLAMAAEEVSDAMAANICPADHVFSARFEKKMDALIRRAAHPVRRQVLRYTAAILAAVVMLFCGMYMLSSEVRATVNGWVRSTFGSYIHYHFASTLPPDMEYEYCLPEEFDGYTQIEVVEYDSGRSSIYRHKDGRLLGFDYIYGTQSAGIFLGVEDSTHSKVKIGTHTADLYISHDPNKNSVIVWEDEATGTIISIIATENRDDLIAIAEKVEKIEKNKN